jgi:SAM-dependent methyltransferase
MSLPPNLKPRLAASYNAIAPAYNAWTSHTNPARLARLAPFLAALPAPPASPDEKLHVLELGCGAGLPVAAALLGVPAVYLSANDLSSAQLDAARVNLAAALEIPALELDGRVDLVEGDMMALSFPAESLAGIVGFYSLIHLPREEQAELLRRVWGWLAPGGVVLANFAAEELEGVVMEKWLKQEEGWMFWSGWGAEATVRLFEEVGFEILSKEVHEDVVNASFLWVLARKKA